MERSTDEEEAKTTTTASPIQENYFKILELFTTQFFLKGKFQNFQIKKINRNNVKVRVIEKSLKAKSWKKKALQVDEFN